MDLVLSFGPWGLADYWRQNITRCLLPSSLESESPCLMKRSLWGQVRRKRKALGQGLGSVKGVIQSEWVPLESTPGPRPLPKW